MKRFLFLPVVILCATLLSGLFGGSYVSAASPYDNLINVQENISVGHPYDNHEEQVDISSSWADLIIDEFTYFHGFTEEHKEHLLINGSLSFYRATGTGRWIVTQDKTSTLKNSDVRVHWTEDDSLALNFRTVTEGSVTFQEVYLTGNDITTAIISNSGAWMGGDPTKASLNQVYTGASEVLIGSNHPVLQPYGLAYIYNIYADHINYPEDYEGEEIPSPYIPGPTNPLQPENLLTVTAGGLMNIKYKDNLSYEFQEGATISISESDSGCSSGTLLGLYTFDNYKDIDLNHQLETYGWYVVNVVSTENNIKSWSGCINWNGKEISIGVVDCEVDEDDFYKCKEIDPDEIYNQCMNSEFPFIHIKDCIGAFGRITSTLSFGKINLFEKFNYESPTDCQEIGKMGDWLGLHNKTMCPQFSSDVRNTVTPFITFGLALAVIGAITTKSRWDMM